MLNPSTADAAVDDPTIRRCVGFAKSYGFGGIEVVNLYAYRATNPEDLQLVDDPVGQPDNTDTLISAAKTLGVIVCAWGTGAKKAPYGASHAAEVLGWLCKFGAQTFSLGPLTKEGYPKHPLYISGGTKLERFALT